MEQDGSVSLRVHRSFVDESKMYADHFSPDYRLLFFFPPSVTCTNLPETSASLAA